MSQARMQWGSLLSAERVGREGRSMDVRSEFARDIDRITFSDAFRRLGRKTQVHPLNENDHVHTRLAHSLEVASVGNSLGVMAGRFLRERGELPETLEPYHVGQAVHAACLAHDIGNPPFGHSGETAIKDWFNAHPGSINHLPVDRRGDFTKFDGNAMSVRIVLSTMFVREGMSPTYAVFGALLKYPWPSSFDAGKDKFSLFGTEAEWLERAAGVLGLPDLGGRFARHPLAYLTEAADDICYRVIDMEDATELGILEEEFLLRKFGGVLGLTEDAERLARYEGYHFRQRNSILRAKLINRAVEEAFGVFKEQYEEIMAGAFDHRSSLMDEAKGGVLEPLREVYASLYKRLFLSRRKAELELGAQHVLGGLLDLTVPAARALCNGDDLFSRDRVEILLGADAVERVLNGGGDRHYGMLMLVLDYVAGMTDHYATDLGRRLRGFGL